MRRLAVLVVLVPLASGCGWASLLLGGGHVSVRHTATVRLYRTAPARDVRRWVTLERLPKRAIPGARLFAVSGCTACHTYAGSGGSNLGAPDLTAIGSRHPGIDVFVRVLSHRPGLNQAMPDFASLGRRRLRRIAVFLEASKGIR